MNDKLQDAINDSLVYLAKYANEYLESDAIERIIQTAQDDNSNPELYLWQTIYEIIKDMDSSPEQEYWFISWIKYAANISSNN